MINGSWTVRAFAWLILVIKNGKALRGSHVYLESLHFWVQRAAICWTMWSLTWLKPFWWSINYILTALDSPREGKEEEGLSCAVSMIEIDFLALLILKKKGDHVAVMRRIKALAFLVGSFASMQRRCQMLTGQNTSLLYPGDFRKQSSFKNYRLQSVLA